MPPRGGFLVAKEMVAVSVATSSAHASKRRGGRPDRHVTKERRERFEALVCAGAPPIDAARELGMTDGNALRTLSAMLGLGAGLRNS